MSDNQDVSQGAAKFDGGKARLDLVPYEFIYAVACVLTYGAIKYDDWNWAKGLRKGRIIAAGLRHMGAYMMGEEIDEESGLPHLWHASTCLCMLVASELRGTAVEDREFALAAYQEAQQRFVQMKDPVNTVKNGGGSVVEPEISEQTFRELQKSLLDQPLPPTIRTSPSIDPSQYTVTCDAGSDIKTSIQEMEDEEIFRQASQAIGQGRFRSEDLHV